MKKRKHRLILKSIRQEVLNIINKPISIDNPIKNRSFKSFQLLAKWKVIHDNIKRKFEWDESQNRKISLKKLEYGSRCKS